MFSVSHPDWSALQDNSIPHCPMRLASCNTFNSQDHAETGFAMTNTAQFWHRLSFVEHEIAEHMACVGSWACPAVQEFEHHRILSRSDPDWRAHRDTSGLQWDARWVSCNTINTQDHAEAGFAKSWHRHAECGFQSQQPLLCDTFKISMVYPMCLSWLETYA